MSSSPVKDLDAYYERLPEEAQECLLAMRNIILSFPEVTEAWKYRMPFFCVRKKMFCYLWTDLKTGQPYLGIVEGKKISHPNLIQGKRARMKILMLDPKKNLPIKTIKGILNECLAIASTKP